MPETTPTATPPAEVFHPATVGSTFMRQYYHLLAKEPASLHRFYKDESTWCHGVGSHMQDAIAGQKAINDEILRRGYAGARVDLDIGSIDCQPSLHGGVFVLVTGVMTLANSVVPKPFVQTFFLAVQPKGYFVLNDCLRFLELPGAAAPSASDAAVAPTDAKKQPAQAAIGTPVAAAVASPPPKGKPVTPMAAAKKDKTPASPVAKPMETPVSPIKVKSPVQAKSKVASPKAAPAAVSSPKPTPTPTPTPSPASPVKKAAPTVAKTTAKPSETKPASPASPAAAPAATPASPAAAKPTPAAPAKPAEPAAPPAPKTWAALFSGAPAAPAAPVTAPKPTAAPAAAAAAKPTPASASPATAPADAAAKPVEAAAAAATTPQEKEKKRFYSLYIRDVPPQTKENDLRELFKAYGTIASVGVPPNRGIAFVDYRDEESMRAALADDKEFKLFDKVLHVEERKDKERSSFRVDTRGGRGGRGAPKSGRTGERVNRDDSKGERRPNFGDANGKAPASNNGPRTANNGDRRDKGGRRSGKEDGGAGGRGGNTTRAE